MVMKGAVASQTPVVICLPQIRVEPWILWLQDGHDNRSYNTTQEIYLEFSTRGQVLSPLKWCMAKCSVGSRYVRSQSKSHQWIKGKCQQPLTSFVCLTKISNKNTVRNKTISETDINSGPPILLITNLTMCSRLVSQFFFRVWKQKSCQLTFFSVSLGLKFSSE